MYVGGVGVGNGGGWEAGVGWGGRRGGGGKSSPLLRRRYSLLTRAAREQIFHPRVTFLMAVLSWRDGGGCRNRWL